MKTRTITAIESETEKLHKIECTWFGFVLIPEKPSSHQQVGRLPCDGCDDNSSEQNKWKHLPFACGSGETRTQRHTYNLLSQWFDSKRRQIILIGGGFSSFFFFFSILLPYRTNSLVPNAIVSHAKCFNFHGTEQHTVSKFRYEDGWQSGEPQSGRCYSQILFNGVETFTFEFSSLSSTSSMSLLLLKKCSIVGEKR